MANRKNVRVAAREAMQRFAYDPLDELVVIAKAEDTTRDVKLDIAKTLLPFAYPKLSNVSVDGEVGVSANADAIRVLTSRLLENPDLADAAQKLSLAAAQTMLENELSGLDPGSLVQ